MEKEKTYTVYTTKDGKKELKVCYATGTAYLLSGYETTKYNNVTLSKIGSLVEELEKYDNVNQGW